MGHPGFLYRILARAYYSPLGHLMSFIARAMSAWKKPRMIYGFRDPTTGKFRKYTRISDTAALVHKHRLAMADHVWVWHHSILDASEGLTIEEGCQIGAWVGVFTHGSETAIRLYGRRFIHVPARERIGYTRGSVRIGAYTFIAAGSLVMPGVTIGRGCIVGANSVVTKDLPDFSIAVGSPAKVVGSTQSLDRAYLQSGDFDDDYYERAFLAETHGRADSSI